MSAFIHVVEGEGESQGKVIIVNGSSGGMSDGLIVRGRTALIHCKLLWESERESTPSFLSTRVYFNGDNRGTILFKFRELDIRRCSK